MVMVWYDGQAATGQRVGSATGFRRTAEIELQQQQIAARGFSETAPAAW